jgi:hypothetical protein
MASLHGGVMQPLKAPAAAQHHQVSNRHISRHSMAGLVVPSWLALGLLSLGFPWQTPFLSHRPFDRPTLVFLITKSPEGIPIPGQGV